MKGKAAARRIGKFLASLKLAVLLILSIAASLAAVQLRKSLES